MWYVTEKIGETRYKTPEGFLVCENVPIARTGIMSYGAGEVPIGVGPDGIVRIERLEADVFEPKTIASFAGKPVTDDHPDEDVNPSNWAVLAKGEVHNPRRGEGIWSDCLVADLFIKDANAIKAVLDGKVEVSCGYDADYEQIAPGRGRQHNIIGNHVALVENGRCGPRCSIGDTAMSKRKSFADRIRAAFKARDEEFEEILKEGEVMDEEGAENGTHVHVHLNGAPAEAKPAEAASGQDEEGAVDPMEARMTKLEQSVAVIAEAVAKMQKAEQAEAAVTTGDENPEEGKEPPKKEPEKTSDEDVLEEGDTKEGKTVDSAGLQEEFSEVVARAEMLVPGIRLPTFDAKPGAKKVRDNLCAMRRKAMSMALESDRSAGFVQPFVRDAEAIKAMTCDAARAAFIGASELARYANNAFVGYEKATKDASKVEVKTIAAINKANADFWATRS